MLTRPLRGAAYAALATLGSCVWAAESSAQEVNWTHTQISTANGAMPSIAVDRLGYVHVGWTLNQGGSSWYAYHVDNQSGDYVQTLVDSRSTSTQAIFPFLSTDSLGFFHLAWRDLQNNDTVMYRTNNPLTRSLVKGRFRGGHTHDPGIDVTPDDVAHLMTEADSCSGCTGGSNIYDEGYAATADRAGPVVSASLVRDSNDATGLQQFSSTVTADGARHLVFSMRLAPPNDNQRLIYYSTRAPGSMTWSTPVSITGHEDNYQGWPAIVSDPGGVLHVVYSSSDYGIYYVNNSGGSWSTPLRINDQNEVVDAIPSIAIDPNGHLHVAFQRFTPVEGGTQISLHYTTNAYDEGNWLDPCSEVLTNISSQGFQLTHQNRKIAINWVDNQVLIPYYAESVIWLASTSDVPVTPPDPGGTSVLSMSSGFVPPVQIVRTTSNTVAAATTALEFDITDAGDDQTETRVREIHVNVGAAQSRPRVLNKDEGLSYLLGGAELVTDTGDRVTGIVSDGKMVFRDTSQALWVPDGGTRSFSLRLWTRNDPALTGKQIELRIKPDQDVVIESGGSAMLTDQPVLYGDVALIVDTLSECPEGSACSDGNPCTYEDACSASGECVGSAVTCQSDGCTSSACNGTAQCTVTTLAPGQACDDGDACTHSDACDAEGVCSGTAISCTDDACNQRSCNGSDTCTVIPLAGGACGGDVDECQLGTDNCSPNATCTNTQGAFTCACTPGYTGDGVICNDVNECELPQSVCDAAATCTNTLGSYTCACNPGYVDDGTGSCVPETVPPPPGGSDPPEEGSPPPGDGNPPPGGSAPPPDSTPAGSGGFGGSSASGSSPPPTGSPPSAGGSGDTPGASGESGAGQPASGCSVAASSLGPSGADLALGLPLLVGSLLLARRRRGALASGRR